MKSEEIGTVFKTFPTTANVPSVNQNVQEPKRLKLVSVAKIF